MKFEQDLLGPRAEPFDVPEGAKVATIAATLSRRAVRMATDALLHEAVHANQMQPLLDHGCLSMAALAHALNRHGLAPDVPHLIEAITALIEDARTVFDKGMQLNDDDRAMTGAVMLEITIRGVFALLGQDYEGQMRARFQPTKETSHAVDDDQILQMGPSAGEPAAGQPELPRVGGTNGILPA